MKTLETFTANPNAVYMLPPEPIDENEKINLSQETVIFSSVCPFNFAVAIKIISFPTTGHSKGRVILPRSPDIRIESGKLVRFSGENEFSLKIGGLQYKAVIFSSVCPFIFVAVVMIFCSFPTTGHSKGRVILPYPVIFFQCAINKFSAASCGGIKASFGLNQIFGQYQFFKTQPRRGTVLPLQRTAENIA